MTDNVILAQGYAIEIEHMMGKVFQYGMMDRVGIGSVASSDFIRRNPLAAVLTTCGYIYGKVEKDSKDKIDNFIEQTRFYWKISLDELLSFEKNTKNVGTSTMELDYKDGKEALEDIIKKFEKICKLNEE